MLLLGNNSIYLYLLITFMRVSNLYKAPKGLIRISAEVENDLIIEIRVTGDFFMVPEDAVELLENHLRGVELSENYLKGALEDFYSIGVVTPMLTKEDFIKAILGAKDEGKAN